MDEKLKGCPHCGGEARVSVSMKDNYFVWCKDCHNQTGYYDKREQAISTWNKRVEGVSDKSKLGVCAECGKELDTDGFFMCRDNFLQVKYFDEPDGSDNMFCSEECACKRMMIEWIRREDY